MAIYHFSAQVIGRSSGRSSVAASAYRAGEKFEDERTGLSHDYTKKQGVEYTGILAPENSPDWAYDREKLWNEVEKNERRKDAQLAREINIALPRELSKEQQIELTENFVKDNFVDKGMIADIAIHDTKNENPHAHIMLTTREINSDGFGKKNREWNNKELLGQWRENWAEFSNKALEKANVTARVDHRSLEAQGVDREAQIHIGAHANAMEKKGTQTDRGNINREIKEANKRIKEIKDEKIILLNEYKEAKEQQRKSNNFFKQFNENERESILKAQGILKKYASIDNIEKGNKYLEKSISFWNGLDEKLTRKMKNLNEADFILSNLKAYKEKYKDLPLFSTERRELKTQISELEDKFNKKIEFIEKYNKYGIKDIRSFEDKYSQLKNEELQKREKYESSRQGLLAKKEIFNSAEVALKEAESRKFIRSYSEFEAYKHIINSNNARSINEINRAAGKKLSFEEIKDLGNKADNIIHEKERLARADKLLSEYEKLKDISNKHENAFGKVKRVFSKASENEYVDLKQNIDRVKNDLKNCKVSNRENFNSQKEILNKEISTLPQWCRDFEVQNRERELNSKNYQLYRQEKRYEGANEVYQELQQYRQQLRETGLLSDDRKGIKHKIQQLEENFSKCKVGSEKDFEKNYSSVKNDLVAKRNIIEEQKKELDKIVDGSKVCNMAFRASKSAVEIHNQQFLGEFYKKDIVKVVNGNEYRKGTDGGSSARNQELSNWSRGISTEGNRYFESSPIEPSRHNESIQRTKSEGQREDNRGIQQDSRSSKYASKYNTGEVLEGTTRGTKESPGANEKQQIRDDIGVKTNDREISSQNRNAFITKNNDSSFGSRFKSTLSNNSSNSFTRSLNEELKKQIDVQKQEVKDLDRVKIKEEKEGEKQPNKSKEFDRER